MINSTLIPIVDSDHIVYRCGFAVKDDEPLEYALATVKHRVRDIWNRFPNSPVRGSLYLTGKGNFRNNVATLAPYKGNRDPNSRPKYYSEIREYMVAHHNATIVDGMEAEDRVGIIQYSNKDKSTVIVGEDKDLLCIPGWHYNPIKDVLMYVTLAEANYNFWGQVLTGDRVDNIPGLAGIGPVKASKLLAPCNKEWLRMQDVVLAAYKKQYGNEAERAMDEVAKLIWILRKEGETYDGSSIEDKRDIADSGE